MSVFKYLAGAAFCAAMVMLAPTFSPAEAQSANNVRACQSGNAEGCFYAGAEIAPNNKQNALPYFLRACELGVPDGCFYVGRWQLYGEGNIRQDRSAALDNFERACSVGHYDGCQFAYDVAILPQFGFRDIGRGLDMMEEGCEAGNIPACKDGAAIAYDGRAGEHPGHVDFSRAGPMAELVCADAYDRLYCQMAEAIYGNPESPTFDAQRGIYYNQLNCNQGVAPSCGNVGYIYMMLEEYELAAQAYTRACRGGQQNHCEYGQYLTNWIRTQAAELAAYHAQQQQRNSDIDGLIRAGRYADAVNRAVHEYRSTDLASRAVLAANNAGAMSTLNTQDLYVLAYWFPSGQVASFVNSQLSARGTGLEGTFGGDTNAAGAAAARYQQQYGSRAPSYTTNSGPTPSSSPVLSSAQASQQTRDRYRAAWCQGSNQNRNVC
jgi:TPR repeat protein